MRKEVSEGKEGGREVEGDEPKKCTLDSPAFLRLYTLEKIPSAVTRTTTTKRESGRRAKRVEQRARRSKEAVVPAHRRLKAKKARNRGQLESPEDHEGAGLT